MYELETKELTQAGIRASRQRLVILHYLNSLMDCHPTVDEIYCALREKNADLSVATVYNTVNLFRQKGLLCSLEYPGETMRYDRRLDDHAHFLCRECGTLYNLPMPEGDIGVRPDGYIVEESHVLMRGICPECAAKSKRCVG